MDRLHIPKICCHYDPHGLHTSSLILHMLTMQHDDPRVKVTKA